MSDVEDRWRAGLPFYVLPPTSGLRRWVSKYTSGRDVFFGLAHGEPQPHPGPLVTVGLLSVRAEGGGVFEPLGTFASELLLAERSRNDPAFQFETRDDDVITQTMEDLDPAADWRAAQIEVDGSLLEFQKREMGGDWIAFRQIGDEYLWIHVERPDGATVSIVTTNDITPYLPIDAPDH